MHISPYELHVLISFIFSGPFLTLLLFHAEILAMFLSVVSIWAVTVVLVLSAVQRISDGEYEIDSEIMLITSGCAVGVNVL